MAVTTNEAIGQRIRARRRELGLTLQEVADEVGVQNSTILRYEKGAIQKIKLPVIEAIASALHVNPSWIVGKTDDPTDYNDGDLLAQIPSSYLKLCNGDTKGAFKMMQCIDEAAQRKNASRKRTAGSAAAGIENVNHGDALFFLNDPVADQTALELMRLGYEIRPYKVEDQMCVTDNRTAEDMILPRASFTQGDPDPKKRALNISMGLQKEKDTLYALYSLASERDRNLVDQVLAEYQDDLECKIYDCEKYNPHS